MSIQSPAILNQIAVSNNIRRLWVDNAQWIRALIYSVFYNIGDEGAILARLEKTADDFGTFFAQYYGEDRGRQVRENYMEYVREVAEMIRAYREGNEALVSDEREAIYDTADQMASLLARVNRFWDEPTMQMLLYALANATENEIGSVASGDYAREIAVHDEFMEQSYHLSDELTLGILRQFRL
ncbi:MAG: hypothetical protein AAGU77_12635 [Bacillota bacterium]